MNLINELKLMIYESNLDEEEMNLCLDAVEECATEDEFYETADNILCLMEGNAYNKASQKSIDTLNYHRGRADILKDNGYDFLSDVEDSIGTRRREDDEADGLRPHKYKPKGIKYDTADNELRHQQRSIKRNWMKTHGDTGMSPEERYKPNKFLKMQKRINDLKKNTRWK